MSANLSRKKGSFRREFLTFFSRNVEMTHTKKGGFARNGAKKVWVSPQKTIDIHLKVVTRVVQIMYCPAKLQNSIQPWIILKF